MAIDSINSLGPVRGADDRKVESDTKSRRQPEASKTQTGDSVDVSGSDITQFAKQLDSIPDVRSDKIETLQKEIASGEYKVPSRQLADIILGEQA